MDFRVEATVLVHCFPDELKVRSLLHSHGFKVTDLGEGRVRVEGYFQRLRDVKAQLEQLLEMPPRSRDPRTPSAPDYGTPLEPIVVDSDVYKYAKHFRKLDNLLKRPDVKLRALEGEESTTISLQGSRSGEVLGELQNLLQELGRSLRTQEVRLKDLSPHGEHLLRKIKAENNTWVSVLVCRTNGGLHLIGPSRESYDLKQRLQGDQSEGRGRPAGRISRGRSSSVPTRNRRGSGGGDGGAAGGPLSKNDDQRAAAAAGLNGPQRRRSLSESRGKKREEKLRRNENQVQIVSERGGKFSAALKAFRDLFKKRKK